MVEDSEIPTDREFRNAWKLDKKKIVIDEVKKAKIIKEKT